MKRQAVTYFLLVLTIIATCLLTRPAYTVKGKYSQESISRLGSLPSAVVHILTPESKGITANLLFLKTIAFMGMKIGEHGNPTKEEWGQINDMLNLITDLDRRFWDPYVFAEMMLVWQAGMLDEADALLHKATVARPEDYKPWYLLGFNSFYFRKDSKKAATYLRKAASYPDCPSFIKGLATRYSLYGNETKLALIMLDELLKETKDEHTRQYLTKRFNALKTIYLLERKVLAFKQQYKRMPKSINELLDVGLLKSIPPDPYGGKFILVKNGRVYTTSELLDKKQEKP